MKRSIKYRLKLMLLSVLTILLCSCGGTERRNKNDIISDLQKNPDFYSVQDVTIDTLDIKKRQTNEEKRIDTVYVNVQASNDNIKCELSYILEYGLYDEGWVLDSVARDFEGEWSIKSLSEPDENLVKEIVTSYSPRNNSSNLEETYTDLEAGIVTYQYLVTEEFEYMTLYSDVYYEFIFNQDTAQWEYSTTNSEARKGDWDICGTWYSKHYNWQYKASFDETYYMEISDIETSKIHVKVYDSEDNTVFIDEDIPFNSIEGADFDVETSDSSWDTKDFFIKPDSIYFDARGTAPGRYFVREETEVEKSVALSVIEDDANIFKDSLTAMVNEVANKKSYTILLVSKNGLNGKSCQEFAEEYFDNSVGADEKYSRNGICFFIDMENREFYFLVKGSLRDKYTDTEIDELVNELSSFLASGDYEGAVKKILEGLQKK